mgnify:CR=1 FL=1
MSTFVEKILSRLVYYASHIYRFFFLRYRESAKCLIENEKGEFLLIRDRFSSGYWNLPGGGLEKGESGEEAVIREVYEEVGITLSAVTPLIELVFEKGVKTDKIFVFTGLVQNPSLSIQRFEVKDARWFSLQDLPSDLHPIIKKSLVALES